MHILSPDSQAQIAKAILQSIHENIQIIELPDGARLRVLGYCGHVAIELLDDSDLFDERVLLDVSMQVCMKSPVEGEA